MNQMLGLSPINEMTDIDLSYLINQLSTTSGEITDRTIEELLRDAERMASPGNPVDVLTVPPPSEQNQTSSPESYSNVSSTNVFMTAIASLSEVTNRIQLKLAEEEKENTKTDTNLKVNTNLLKKQLPSKNEKDSIISSKTAVYKPMLKQNVVQSKLRLNSQKTSSLSVAKHKNGSSRRIEKEYSKPWRITPRVAADPRLNSQKSAKLAASSSMTRSGVTRKRIVMHRVDDNSSSGTKSSVSSPTKPISSHCRQGNSSDSCQNGGGLLRKLREDNARLNLQIRQLQDQLKAKPVPKMRTTLRKPIMSADRVADLGQRQAHQSQIGPKIDEFQHQLNEIQMKYESQIQSLTEKCKRLEQLPEPIADPVWPSRNIAMIDRGCQTEKEKRDAGCQSDRTDGFSKEQIILDELTPKKDATTQLENQGSGPDEITETRKMPEISFEMDGLNLDDHFVPWHENPNKNVPEKLAKPDLEVKNNKILKTTAKVTKNGDQHLLTTIRGLQMELETKTREIRRLKNETEKTKSKPNERFKSSIRRTIGTQTVGFGACTALRYDPKLFQDAATLAIENEKLKTSIKRIETEMMALNEKRMQDLKLLQEKHEEEISTLLEQKLFLANKLDALLARNFR